MKKLITCLFLFTAALFGDEQLRLDTNNISGKSLVQEVHDLYLQGKYQSFLKALDEEFQRAGKAGILSQLVQEKQNRLPKTLDPKKWTLESIDLSDLSAERNERLLHTCSEHPDSIVIPLIERVVYFSLDPQQKEAFKVMSELYLSTLKEGLSPHTDGLESELKAIELEAQLKSSLLDIAAMKNKTTFFEIQKKKLAITLRKLDLMEKAAVKAKNEAWIQTIAEVKRGFEGYYGHQLELNWLKQLAKGEIVAADSTEAQVKEIMKQYLSKQKELAQK